MSRSIALAASALLVGTTALVTQLPASAAPAGGSHGGSHGGSRPAAGQELSVTTRLADRREVAAGTRAYSIGFQDGRFYANGWHITGEMGGVWTPPMKMVDGVWFGLDGQWVGPATRFTSGWGYTKYELPNTAGLQVRRTDFVPDGTRRRALRLTVTNPARPAGPRCPSTRTPSSWASTRGASTA